MPICHKMMDLLGALYCGDVNEMQVHAMHMYI